MKSFNLHFVQAPAPSPLDEQEVDTSSRPSATLTSTTRRIRLGEASVGTSEPSAPSDALQSHLGWRRHSKQSSGAASTAVEHAAVPTSAALLNSGAALSAALDLYIDQERGSNALFASKFRLLPERVSTADSCASSLVQFASDSHGGYFHFALRFFFDSAAFDAEVAAYARPQLAAVLPQLRGTFPAHCEASPAAAHSGTYRSEIEPSAPDASRRADDSGASADRHSGRGASSDASWQHTTSHAAALVRYPPFLVTERAMPLAEWQAAGRPALVLAMFQDVARLLAAVHANGRVHTRVSPRSVLLLLQTQAWRLCSFRSAQLAGAAPSVVCVRNSSQLCASCGQAISLAHLAHDASCNCARYAESITKLCQHKAATHACVRRGHLHMQVLHALSPRARKHGVDLPPQNSV